MITPCYICKKADKLRLYKYTGDEMKEYYCTYCERCHQFFTNPYHRDYGLFIYKEHRDKAIYELHQKNANQYIYQARIDDIERFLRQYNPDVLEDPNRKILDSGAGGGQFIKECFDRGWNVAGCEPFWDGHVICPEDVRPFIYYDFIETARVYDKFDVISGYDSFECTVDPVATLQKMKRLLKPGGIIVQCIPLVWDGTIEKSLEKTWKEVDMDPGFFVENNCSMEQIVNYDKEAIDVLVSSVGLKIIEQHNKENALRPAGGDLTTYYLGVQ